MNEEQAERLIAAMERIATTGERLAPMLRATSEGFHAIAAQTGAAAQSSRDFTHLLEGFGGSTGLTRNP